MIIRDEQPSDIEAIFRLTVEAFKNHRFGDHTEQFINDALRETGALTLSARHFCSFLSGVAMGGHFACQQ